MVAGWESDGRYKQHPSHISCAVITLFPLAEIITKVVLVMVVVFLLNKTSRIYAHIVLEVNQLKAVFLLNRSEIYSSFKRDC